MPAVLFLMFGDDLLNKDPAKRAVIYVMGLFIMTLGVSISVKSNLGVSPVSSIVACHAKRKKLSGKTQKIPFKMTFGYILKGIFLSM